MSLADYYRPGGGQPKVGNGLRQLLRLLLSSAHRRDAEPSGVLAAQPSSPQSQAPRNGTAPTRVPRQAVRTQVRKYYPPQRDPVMEQASLAREMYRL